MNEQSTEQKLQLIDVEATFASKDENLLKKLPRFFIRYLKRIARQEEINRFLIDNEGIEGLEFVNRAVAYMGVQLTLRNPEKLPANSRVIFASNHPLGGFDGLCLLKTIAERHHPGIKSVSNDLLMNVQPLRSMFIGVNKHGGNSKEYVEEMQETFKGENPVLFFPSGLVSRRRWFKIRDTEWKSTFIKKAIQYKRDVIPIHVTGRVSGFFYRLANLRKLLRIRYNIEMLYLPNEQFKQQGAKITITFGDPISYQTFDRTKKPGEWALSVRKLVYEMGKSI